MCAGLLIGACLAAAAQENAPATPSKINIQLDGVAVGEAMQILSDATGFNILVSSKVAGNFTAFIVNMEPERALQEAIAVNGLHYVRNGDVVWVLTPDEYFEDHNLGRERRVMALRHASVESVVPALEPLLSSHGKLTPYPETNVLVIAELADRIDALTEVATRLDSPPETRIYALNYGTATEVAALLQPHTANPDFVQADPRTNQVAITETPENLARLEKLLARFDQPGQIFSRSFVLSCANAEEVATLLQDLLTGSKGSAPDRSSPGAAPAQAAPAPSPAPTQGTATQEPGRPLPPANGADETAAKDASLGPLASVVADPRTNTVIVTHSAAMLDRIGDIVRELDAPSTYHVYQFQNVNPADLELDKKLAGILPEDSGYFSVDPVSRKATVRCGEKQAQEILGLFRQWDAVIQQVQIEAEILAVNASLLKQLGISWQAVLRDAEEGVRNLDASAQFLPGLAEGSPRGSLVVGNLETTDYEAAIQALTTDSNTKIIARPHILVRDGESAVFSSVRNEPYKEIVVDGNTQTTLENVRFLEVGVRLVVTPTVNADGVIGMNVQLEISSLASIREGIPVVDQSAARSVVSVRDGHTLILGGLRQQSRNHVENGVPGLRKVPVMGNLFRNKRNDDVDSEIVLVLRPVVIGAAENAYPEPSTLDQRIEREMLQPLLLP